MLQQTAPYFGYAASLCLIIALLVTTDSKFRIYNILGTVFFIIYGSILHFWPVLITNGILFFINIYYLNKLYLHKENFDIIEVKAEEKLAEKFLSYNHTDVASYFPAFTFPMLSANLNFVVLRDLVIANIFSARLHANGDAVVDLNYTTKKYRDYKIGKFIFEKEKQFLLSKGIKRIVYEKVENKGHEDFLKVTGFTKIGDGYFKEL